MTVKIIPETYFLVQEELLLFGGACLLGLPAGIFFDLLRAVRAVFPHHGIAVALEDIVFCCLCAMLLLCYTFAFARGEFRLFYVWGFCIGFVLYICTAGSLFLKCFRKIIRICKRRKQNARICRKWRRIFGSSAKKTENASKNTQKPLQDASEV